MDVKASDNNDSTADRKKYRVILSSPFSHRTITSYGLLVYAKDTKRWAIVQRKHSVEFLLFMKGSYRLSHLSILLSAITLEELKSIRLCALSFEHFKHIYISELYFDDIGLDYAYSQFSANYYITMDLLSRLDLSQNQLKWTWPKGRISYSNNESMLDCAVREFEEEVEFNLPMALYISDSYISEKFFSINNRAIESRYWIYVIEHEIDIPPVTYHPEVADRKWASTEECSKLLTFDFTAVKSIINNL